jgi:hypothetical protein
MNAYHTLQAHPWLSDKEKEELCNIIDYQKLSIHACAHASQNDRLPLRVVLQVLFFEQLHLRTALAGCVNALDRESAPAAPARSSARGATAGDIVQRDGWVSVVRENQVLKVDMDRMSTRVGELEEEFSKIKKEMKTATKSHSTRDSPRFLARKLGCKLIPRFSDAQPESLDRSISTPRVSTDRAHRSHKSRHTESFS